MFFLTFLAEPPGSWLYTFALLAALEAPAVLALQQWWGQRRHGGGPRAAVLARLALATWALFLLRAAVAVFGLLIPEGSRDALALLPPLDRATAAITALALVWLLAYPEPSFSADVGLIVLSLTALTGLAVEWVWWTQAVVVGVTYFNGSLDDTIWVVAIVLVLAGGAWLLSRRRPAGWRAGLGLLGLLLLGYAIYYLYPVARYNTAGVVRWAELIALPLAMLLLARRALAWQRPDVADTQPIHVGPRPRPLWQPLLETLLVAGVVYFALEFATARTRVEGPSMLPGLRTGEYVLIDKLAYRLGSPQRGDLVTVRANVPGSPEFIKRLLGLPGDTLAVKAGALWINGAQLSEPYVAEPPKYVGAWQLGPDDYFVLGDNRNNSDDSHVWGTIHRSALTGKAVFIYWPPIDVASAANYSFGTP